MLWYDCVCVDLNLVVFFDVMIGGVSVGWVMFEFFVDVVLKMCENFR